MVKNRISDNLCSIYQAWRGSLMIDNWLKRSNPFILFYFILFYFIFKREYTITTT
ncbi:protein of unknown function [Moritella yayanosii]|uniref:Uncharacterized protein n=1 Tax=Moritella yayanosii TaxID=69539 RepID=A0A330LT21_9GAMM|nr:protein of unknown function [Moritella yayanosii]